MISKKKLTEKVHLLRELERMQDDLETQIEHLKDEIKAEMDKRGVIELIGEDWKVTWTPYEASRFDQSGFKEVHPDLYEEFKKTYESRRFTVK